MNKKLPVSCPSCNSELKVKSLYCDSCETTINGVYPLPLLLMLDQQELNFILEFIQSSGSLKIMAQKLKLSYPTVRNKLDDLIEKLLNLQNES